MRLVTDSRVSDQIVYESLASEFELEIQVRDEYIDSGFPRHLESPNKAQIYAEIMK